MLFTVLCTQYCVGTGEENFRGSIFSALRRRPLGQLYPESRLCQTRISQPHPRYQPFAFVRTPATKSEFVPKKVMAYSSRSGVLCPCPLTWGRQQDRTTGSF